MVMVCIQIVTLWLLYFLCLSSVFQHININSSTKIKFVIAFHNKSIIKIPNHILYD